MAPARLLPGLVATALAAASPAAAQAPKPEPRPEADREREERVETKALRTLEDRIPPVSGRMFAKQGRFEIAPGVAASFADPFFAKYLGSLSLGYHVLESLALTLRGSGGVAIPSGLTAHCPAGVCDVPLESRLPTAPGRISVLASLAASWSPFYGKLNLLAEWVLHFDLYLSAGGALVISTIGSTSANAPGAVVAVGQRVFLNRWIAVRFEVSDTVYPAGVTDQRLVHQFLFDLGVSFFLPTTFDAER